MKNELTNCGECKHGDIKYFSKPITPDNKDDYSVVSFKCRKGRKEDIECCPDFENKQQGTRTGD